MSRSSGSEPQYILLYRKLAFDISSGIYKPGDKFPSKRVIAEKSGLSLVTVEHALELLTDEGYIAPKERSGCYVIYSAGQFSPPSGMSHSGQAITSVAPMKAEDLPGSSFPFTAWAKTIRQILSERQRKIFEKSHNRGNIELREALSGFLARSRRIICSPDNIIIGSGSVFLYARLIRLLGRDRIFAIESPSYEMISKVYTDEKVNYEMLKTGSGGILSHELAASRASVLHVTPYRSFPSGATAQVGKRMEYIEWASGANRRADLSTELSSGSQTDRYIIEDDVESEFTVLSKSYDPLFTLTDSDNVIYMNSFSVTLSPALRIAYMVLPEKLSEKYSKSLELYPCPVPTFEQLILAEFIRSGEFERYINRVRREKRNEARKTGELSQDQTTL